MRGPSLTDIRTARERLGDRVRTTPTWQLETPWLAHVLGSDTRLHLKLELLQHTGSFKPRGALLTGMDLSPVQLDAGLTAVSAGNHALAVAFTAQSLGTTAKVAMPETADPARIERCRFMGAEVVLEPTVHNAFARVRQIEAEEGRTFIHPFDGPTAALGTATVALEFLADSGPLDFAVLPIGGGGLCAGMSAAIKQLQPDCTVIGVEPTGADTMHRSFAAGSPQSIDKVTTMADSLGAPFAMDYSFEVCRENVDELVLVEDDDLRCAMAVLFHEAKMAVEPAGAATTAALLGPLRERVRGHRAGAILCGANVAPAVFADSLLRGEQLRESRFTK